MRRRSRADSLKQESEEKKDLQNEEDEDDEDDDDPISAPPSSLSLQSLTMAQESLQVPLKKPFSWQNFFMRTFTTFSLLGVFYTIIYLGHVYCIILVVIVQAELYRELVNVRYVEAKERKMPYFRTLQWGWFFVPMFFICKTNFLASLE